jgi:WD40 repeat protein
MKRNLFVWAFLCLVVAYPVDAQEKLILPHHSFFSMSFSPDSKKLAVGHGKIYRSADREVLSGVLVWDVTTGNLFQEFVGHSNDVTALAWTKSSKTLISASAPQLRDPPVSQVIRWDVEGGKILSTRELQGGGGNRAFSPDGSFLVTIGGHKGKIATVWDLDENKKTTLPEHRYHVKQAAFATDRKAVATTDAYQIKIWELPSGKEMLSVQPDEEGGVESLAFAADNKTIVYQNQKTGRIQFLDCRTGKQKSLLINARFSRVFALSPDGKLLATGYAKEGVDPWSVAMGKVVHTLKAPQQSNSIIQIAFSPDGRSLAAADSRGNVYLWDAPK